MLDWRTLYRDIPLSVDVIYIGLSVAPSGASVAPSDAAIHAAMVLSGHLHGKYQYGTS